MRIIHLLQWDMNTISKYLDKIKEQGFTHIQLSPVQGTKEDSNLFWVLYQPTNLKIGNSQIGSREELISLCEQAHSIGLKIIVDVVLRHVATDNNDWSKPHSLVDKELLKYVKNTDNATNYYDRYEITRKATGMPMLDYDNTELQKLYIEFLDDLIACGVDSFRLDQLKHYALPNEGSSFLTNVFGRYTDRNNYGECINCQRELVNEYSKYMLVGTEPMESNINNIVTWIESHDSYLNDDQCGYTRFMSNNEVIYRYKEITKSYPNTIMYARPFNDLWLECLVKEANIN